MCRQGSCRTWVCATAIMADEQVCQGPNIRQPPQDEHIQGAALEQRPATGGSSSRSSSTQALRMLRA